MNKIAVKIKKLAHFKGELPNYATHEAAGADIRACLSKPLTINPGQRVLIPTGLTLEIPKGFEIQIRPRSGLSLKTDLLVVNSPGTIDSDYRGELKILMGNFGNKAHEIFHGDRVAQMVLAPVLQASFELVSEISETARGIGGFGSTGIH